MFLEAHSVKLFYFTIMELFANTVLARQYIMQKSIFRFTQSFYFIAFLGFIALSSSNVFASLSTKPATPSQWAKQQSNHINNSQKVLNVYRQWAGTRYRLGGTTKAGIDCSAFVRTTMSSAFNVQLPRSTAEQRYAGYNIAKSELRPGDLVFFRNNNHVGVYIGDGKFVHAGSSTGVTIASLSDKYWAKTYTQSRRVM